MAETKPRTHIQRAWGIVNDEGLLPFTIRESRVQAIQAFIKDSGYDIPEDADPWRWLQLRGNACVYVTLTFTFDLSALAKAASGDY